MSPGVNSGISIGLRLAMRRMAGTVFIVAAGREGNRCGLTATSVASLSMDPPALIVCINQRSSTYTAIAAERRFSVNLLGNDALACARAFSSESCLGEDRFLHGRWTDSECGVPVMHDADASVLCGLESVLAYGSHVAVIGRVIEVKLRASPAASPLLYFDGAYRSLPILERQS